MDNKIIRFILWLVAFTATLFLAAFNPIDISGWLGLVYFAPFLAISYNMIQTPVKAKGLFDEPKYLNGLKSLITLLMMLLAAGVKIPLLSQLIDLLGLVVGNWDEIGGVVKFVLAFYVSVRSIFATGDTPIIGPVAKMISPTEFITPQKR